MSFISILMNTKYNDNATNLTSSGLIEIEFLNQLGKKLCIRQNIGARQ